MSRNGSGVYSLPAGNPVVTGTSISSTWSNTTLSDIATALTGSVASDGQTPMTGALDMNSQKVINLLNGTLSTDAINLGQLTTAFNNPTFTGTEFMLIPKGTTAQRPAVPVDGEMRYNTTTNQFEGYQDGAWGQLGGGATGGGGDEVFVENARVVTVNYTLSTGKSAESVGPITINSGITVTIPSDERWVIL
tara:strand:- start:4033 stop:4608 length:576 start_codon:yes stop_codon:yes gene_type:complete